MTRREGGAEARAGWGFITPAMLLIGVFFAIPVVSAVSRQASTREGRSPVSR